MYGLVFQAVASGIVIGMVYSLIALSIVIIYKSTHVVNFSGGEIVMVGGYVALLGVVYFQFNYFTIFLFVAATVFMVGVLFERIVLRKILATAGQAHRASHNLMISLVIATVGLSFALKGLVRVIPYTEEVRRLPPLFSGPPVFIGPAILQRQDIAIVVIAILVILGLAAFFHFTLTGKALRATSENPRAAALVGIPIGLIRTLVWGIAATLGGLAGCLLAPKLLLTPDIGSIVLLAFAAAIIGGFTSLAGCIVGGLTLGIVENLVGIFISSQAIAPTPFLLIMIVLLVRPQGLFGGAPAPKKV